MKKLKLVKIRHFLLRFMYQDRKVSGHICVCYEGYMFYIFLQIFDWILELCWYVVIFRFSFYKQFFVFKYKRYITSLTHEDVIFINWKLQGRIQRLFLRKEESSEMERKNNPIRLPRCKICNYLWFVHCQVCGCTLAQRSKYTLSHDRTQLCLWK